MAFNVRILSLLVLATFAFSASADAAEPLLSLESGDKIVTVGNTQAERMQQFGNFETLLHSRFPEHKLVVRGLGWSGDELSIRMRSLDFDDHGHRLVDHKPSVIIAFYGFNESFAGPAGLPKFEEDLKNYIEQTTTTPYDGETPPRLVLVSPIAHENLQRAGLPDGKQTNDNLRLYTEAMRRVASEQGVPLVDLFTPTLEQMAQAEQPWTINGIHLNDAGDKQVSRLLDTVLFGDRPADENANLAKLEREVDEKNQQFWYDYRAVNGYYIYGGRKNPFGVVNFPAEFVKLRNMIARRDERIWAVAQGKAVPDKIDDSGTGEFVDVETNYPDPIVITTPDDEKSKFVLADGYEANLYASDIEFPDLEKPVQFEFDGKGRLWVTTMGSYPMYLPGTPVNDKVLIFEDTNADGKADKQTVFADKMYLPTGIELGDRGAYVAQQPNLMFLRDTDGDDHADEREIVLHGFDTADSHHSISAFTWGPGGELYFQEGTFHQTAVETPYGPMRAANASVYRYEPRTAKLETFVSYPFANPWGHVFDGWGQNFVADASPGANYFGTAFSGQVDYPHKHGTMQKFLNKQWRPTSGCEFVSSRHFPDEAQGLYLLNNVIGFHGILAYKMQDDGSGFFASPVTPILESKDQNFRPVDLKFGPDGALYVIDWFNPLIGHMQHSVRDPKRDKTHGRIWRITYKGRPLVEPAKIAGASIPDLLELLKTYETRTRYRVRRELRNHDTAQVMAELDQWMAALDKNDPSYEHLLLEALWVRQHHDVVDQQLLGRMLRSPDYRARAAATRVLCYWRDRVENPLDLLSVQANDEHPRVRLEAVRAASFFHEPRATDVALETLIYPQDSYLSYTLKETLDTLGRREQAARRADPEHFLSAESNAVTLVRLLKSGRLPKDQIATVIELACQRANAEELAYIYAEAIKSDGYQGDARLKALRGLAAAARTRKVKPAVNHAELASLLGEGDDTTRVAAMQLAGAWQAAELSQQLTEAALAKDVSPEVRQATATAIASIGGVPAKNAAAKLLADSRPQTQSLGVQILVGFDIAEAAQAAATRLANPAMQGEINSLLEGFMARQNGTDQLAEVLAGSDLPVDSAKLVLRQLLLAGRSDPALVAVLTKAAGIDNQPVDLSPPELQKISAEALAKGNAARGELVFRRGDLGCMKCHSVSGAGGDVGPDLSPVGATSPADYMITSVLNPDLNIKEVYLTKQFVTADGLVFSGNVVDRDENRVVVKDANGHLSTIATADIELEVEGKSLMPKGLAGFMTHAEFLDLVRFLSELGKPGAFAVRSQPTIQRYRVLSSTPEGLADMNLDPQTIARSLAATKDEDWQPAYARVAGDLPLDEILGQDRQVLYLSGQVEVTEGGEVEIKLDSPQGVSVWVGNRYLAPDQPLVTRMKRGIHTIYFRIDPAHRDKRSIRATVQQAENSNAGLTVVGGT